MRDWPYEARKRFIIWSSKKNFIDQQLLIPTNKNRYISQWKNGAKMFPECIRMVWNSFSKRPIVRSVNSSAFAWTTSATSPNTISVVTGTPNQKHSICSHWRAWSPISSQGAILWDSWKTGSESDTFIERSGEVFWSLGILMTNNPFIFWPHILAIWTANFAAVSEVGDPSNKARTTSSIFFLLSISLSPKIHILAERSIWKKTLPKRLSRLYQKGFMWE